MTKTTLGAIIRMRRSGCSLQQIADSVGLSRERVRQLLVKHCGSTRVEDFLGATELAQQAGCSQNYIRKLRRCGIIQPAKVVGKKRTLWKPKTVNIIIAYRTTHRCQVCDAPLPDNRWSYCSHACWIEAYRHRYIKMSKEARKLHNERVTRWQNSHKEQAKEIRQRSQRKYEVTKSRERYETTIYMIRARCAIPLGTLVTVTGPGEMEGTAKVEWGNWVVEVPWYCVKRITGKTGRLGRQPGVE